MSDYTELQKAAAYAAQDAIKFADEDEEIRALQQFHEEVDPETVLALIAENEELGRYLCTCRDCGGEGALHTGDWHSYGHMEPPEPVMEKCGECDGTGLLGEIQDLYQVITERDQLKAELEKAQLIGRLAYNFDNYKAVLDERDQLKAENERLRADYAGLARFNPEWDRVAAAQDSVREHMAMVVQLKAENAGLKTGYEAYEQVNAELKAEVEGLRREREGKVLCDLELFETLRDSANTEADEHRQCMATYRPLRQASLDSVVKKCDYLLAALGKGEQS